MQGNPKRESTYNLRCSVDARRRLAELRANSGLSPKDFATVAGVSTHTLRNVENPDLASSRVQRKTLIGYAKALGVPLEQVLNIIHSEAPVSRDPESQHQFSALLRMARRVDGELIRVIRELTLEESELISTYASLRRGIVAEHQFESLRKIQEMDTKQLLSVLAQSIPNSDLRIQIRSPFREVEYSCEGASFRIVNPLLLWDCHCQAPGGSFTPRTCPIHKHDAAAEVSKRFGSGDVLLVHAGNKFLWRDEAELWPPSVDSFRMLQDLRAEGVPSDTVRSLLDLGSGTGFLGISLALASPKLEVLAFSDWLYVPLLYSLANWAANQSRRSYVNVSAHLGVFTSGLDKLQLPYDLVICAPPYLPILPDFRTLAWSGTVAGTDLLCHVIRNAKRIGREVYVLISDLAWPEAKTAASSAGMTLQPIGKTRLIPFRVPYALSNQDYMNALVKDLRITDDAKKRHRYWHSVRTYRVG